LPVPGIPRLFPHIFLFPHIRRNSQHFPVFPVPRGRPREFPSICLRALLDGYSTCGAARPPSEFGGGGGVYVQWHTKMLPPRPPSQMAPGWAGRPILCFLFSPSFGRSSGRMEHMVHSWGLWAKRERGGGVTPRGADPVDEWRFSEAEGTPPPHPRPQAMGRERSISCRNLPSSITIPIA